MSHTHTHDTRVQCFNTQVAAAIAQPVPAFPLPQATLPFVMDAPSETISDWERNTSVNEENTSVNQSDWEVHTDLPEWEQDMRSEMTTDPGSDAGSDAESDAESDAGSEYTLETVTSNRSGSV